MKRSITTLAVILLVSAVFAFALTGCNVKLKNMDGSEYYTAIDRERSLELIEDFFSETLKSPDFVVTCKDKDGETIYTETVKGTSSCTLAKDGTETYAFKKGSNYYVAYVVPSENGDGSATRSYYCSDSTKPGYYAGGEGDTMEDMYNAAYCLFLHSSDGIGIVRDFSESGAEYRCVTHIEWLEDLATGTLTYTYTASDRTVTLSASSEEELVLSVRLVIEDTVEGGRSGERTWTFVHGGAAVSIPDTDAWDARRS